VPAADHDNQPGERVTRPLLTAVAVSVLAACAGRPAPEPIYELRATEQPLRYDLASSQTTVIELPTGGEQEIVTSTDAVLTLSYGAPAEAGLPFVLTFEELDVSMQGMPGGADLSGVIGEPIRGTVGSDGAITVEEAPEVDVPGFDGGGLADMISPLMIPLPPDADPSAESWPLQRSRDVGGGMTGESSFDGTVRFAPETAWQGQPARILVSEGDLRQRASGQPPGAPGEVDIDLRGESTTTYAWDPVRGVVLHVDQEAELEGTLSMQNMGFPMATTASQTFELLP